MIQGSEQWFNARLGRFTSSQIHRLLTNSAPGDTAYDSLSKGAQTYVMEKVDEVITGERKEFTNQYVRWGEKWESHARVWYELKTGREVEEVGFIPFGDHAGGSPDGLTKNGGLEIKCPKVHHWSYMREIHDQESFMNHPKIKSVGYYSQVQSLMLFTHREWWDWVTYHPRDWRKGKIVRIDRDDDHIDLILTKLKLAIDAKLEILTDAKVKTTLKAQVENAQTQPF